MMESKTIGRFSLKSDQQGLEFVNPGKGSLTDETTLVHHRVEISFASTLDPLSVALVLRDVGLDPAIPQHLPRCSRIEATIRIEDSTFVVQSTPLHISKGILELLDKLVSIIMIASNDACRCKNIAVRISYRQDVAGLGLLPRLSSDTFTSPLIVMTLASKRRWRLPSLLHLRK